MGEVIELEIPAQPGFLAVARLVVAAAASLDPTFADDRVADLRLAVSEACTNAIEAQARANRESGSTEGVLVRCEVGDGMLLIEVGDHGAGFDPSRLSEHPPVTDPSRLDYERGLGIPLIRLLTDEVEFRTSDRGTTVKMVVLAFPGGAA